MSFLDYKKNRMDISILNKKVDELAEASKSKYAKDDRFWKPTVDKVGNGSATIRYLPPAEGEDLPWIQYYEHNFDFDGNFFIEMCPTTLGRECPVCKANSILWKTEDEDNQNIVRDRKRKLVYISNIIVLKDKEATENEGKVFLFRYGLKLYEKIKGKLKPKDEEDQPVVVFDLLEGADFRLEICNVKSGNRSYRNYDESKFRTPSPLFKGDDVALEQVYNALYKLQPFVEDKKFKPYDDLQKRLTEVLEGPQNKVQKKADELFGDTPEKEETAKDKKSRKPKTETSETPWEEAVRKPTARKTKEAPADPVTEEDVPIESDDALDYYDNMVNKD